MYALRPMLVQNKEKDTPKALRDNEKDTPTEKEEPKAL